ncbi:MAG: pantetheine-phosphate adenylyltransferase [Candidatus Nomurabacteria bacterium]|jgi:pantetheine-phosphate adenylyltransferase|nr:pantetheine-phosphate adenylyltransferase [Candidatus Nomurabacteria bacterium]
MKKTIGVYAGSFDPFTFGHLGITRQAAQLFDEIIILIAHNAEKTARIDPKIIRKLITEILTAENLTNVKVAATSGASARFAQQAKASFLIRGLRNQTDFQYEETIAQVNRQLTGLKTVYFRADDSVSYVSSSLAMDLFNIGEDVSQFLPANIIEYLRKAK